MLRKAGETRLVDDSIRSTLRSLANRAGWVLAGGKSSRMGTDKALLEFDGLPLAAGVALIASTVCGKVTLIGDPEKYGHLDLPVIPDRLIDCGPLAGIETALSATTVDWNLIVACDMPALYPELLEKLFELAKGFDGAVPQHASGRMEPLCAVYHRRCGPAVRAALDLGVRKITDILGGLAIRYVRGQAGDAFRNLNTPADLAPFRNG